MCRWCASLLQERPDRLSIMKAVAAVLAILLFAAAATNGAEVGDQEEGQPGFGSFDARAARCVDVDGIQLA